jgi:hypothetical protein
MQPGDKLLPQLTVHARDWFEGQPIGRVAKELWDKGYSFDYVSDVQLKTAKADNSEVVMPSGKHRTIIVPECEYIPLETFKKLLSLAEGGAWIKFQTRLPEKISGMERFDEKQKEFDQLKGQLPFQERNIGRPLYEKYALVGQGRVEILPHYWLSLRTCIEPMSQAGLSYIRRSFGGGWNYNYFIANRTENNFDGWILLGKVYAKSVIILDPMTGRSGVASTTNTVDNGHTANLTKVRLQLAAGESVILRAFADKKMEGPAWTYWQTNGQSTEISGDWKVKFLSGGPTLPADFSTAKLASWTTFPDTNCQAFGGTAKYETTFAAPDSAGKTFELNLGDVQQSARVRVNGKDYGTLITPPFRVVVDNLKPTGNTLEVEVTSVDANRIRDLDRRGVPWKTFRDINIVNINYKPFDASSWPLTDCGLLGPVTLTPVTAEK